MKPAIYLWVSLTLFCAACSNSRKTAHSADNTTTMESLTGKRWKLVELNGQPVADKINGKEPFIEFHDTDKRYSASGGCNGLGGTYTLSNNGRITFSQGMSTMMACEDMTIE